MLCGETLPQRNKNNAPNSRVNKMDSSTNKMDSQENKTLNKKGNMSLL